MASEGLFPRQNISTAKKTKEWHKENVLAMLAYQNYTTKFNRERKKDYENYLLFNGVFDTKQFEYITNTYGISSPARLVNHPIIAPKIELLVGEFMNNPLDITAEAINEDAVIRKLDKKVDIVAEKILRPIKAELSEALGIDFSESDEVGMEIPDDIDKFMRMNFREQVEELTIIGLKYLTQRYDLKHVFKMGLYDECITAKEFYYQSIKNGDPFTRRVDPRALIYDMQSDSESLQSSAWVAEERFLTVNEIVDEYGSFLSVEEVNKIEKMRYEGQDSLSRYNKPYQWYYKDDSLTPMRIRTVIAVWKSLRTVNIKVSENKYDPDTPFQKILPDSYKPKKGDKIKKKVITEIRQATMIGHSVIVDYRPSPNQIRVKDNNADAYLPYVGIIKNNIDGITLSIVDSIKNIQLLYNIVMFHIELTLARSGGKAVVYDTSQKPNGLKLEDVFYHAKNSGVIPINTKQEGNQVGSGFNQFQQIDFTLSNSVQQLLNLKMMLENTVETLTGISRAREGFQKTDAVGVNERSVIQSSLVTQPLFANHYRTIEMVYQQLSDLMKIAWSDGHRVSFFAGDGMVEMSKVTGDLKNADLGIFVTNSSKDRKDKDGMIALGQNILSGSGVDGFLQMIKMVNADTAKEAETTLEQGLDAMKKQEQAMQEQQAQAQQQQAEATQQAAQMEAQSKQADNEAKIQVAQIQAEAMIESTRLKISGGQETQDFRQQHDKGMAMLNSSNEMSKEQQRKGLDEQIAMEEDSEKDPFKK